MSKVAIEDTILDNIVDSVNKKTHGNDQMRPQDIPATVDGIKTEKPEQEKTVTVTKNGDTVVTPDTGKTLSKATVKVAVPSDKKPEVAGKETITQNGKQTFTPPAGSVYSSFEVTTNTPAPKPEQTKDYTITANGDTPIVPDPGKVITGGNIKVNVPSKTPVIKPITITANGTTTAPAGTDGYSPITVNVPSGGGGIEVVPPFTDVIFTSFKMATAEVPGGNPFTPGGTEITSFKIKNTNTIKMLYLLATTGTEGGTLSIAAIWFGNPKREAGERFDIGMATVDSEVRLYGYDGTINSNGNFELRLKPGEYERGLRTGFWTAIEVY